MYIIYLRSSISGYLKGITGEATIFLRLVPAPVGGPWTNPWTGPPLPGRPTVGTFSFSQHHFFLPKDQPCFQFVSPVGNGKQMDRKARKSPWWTWLWCWWWWWWWNSLLLIWLLCICWYGLDCFIRIVIVMFVYWLWCVAAMFYWKCSWRVFDIIMIAIFWWVWGWVWMWYFWWLWLCERSSLMIIVFLSIIKTNVIAYWVWINTYRYHF